METDSLEILLACRICSKEYYLATTIKAMEQWLVGYPQGVLSQRKDDDIASILDQGLCRSCKVNQHRELQE